MDKSPTMAGYEVLRSIEQEAKKESGMNNKPHDQWTNTERDHYNIIHEKIKNRTVNTFLKNAKKTDGKDQDIYKVFGDRVVYQTQMFPSGYSTADGFHCHSAFIIDNHEEIQELKKQMAAMNGSVVVDKELKQQLTYVQSELACAFSLWSTGQEENRELRQELAVMRSELANLKAASTLDDIDDDEDEQPVITPVACEPKVSASRAADTRIDNENRRWSRGAVASMKKTARGISSTAREHSDRHYEQVCKDWLS